MRREPAPSDTIRGQIESVRVLREGWGKASVRIGDGAGTVVTLTGTVLGREAGETIEARGRWEESAQWGKQFRATTIDVAIPQSAGGAIAWLAATLPGLGRKRAAEVVERFGATNVDDVWHVIEHAPSQLEEIRGITPEGAQRIHAAYAAVKHGREDGVTLRSWGLGDWAIKAVREAWGNEAVAELRRDPYQLSERVRGFGFVKADEVARKMGMPTDAPSRIRAALCHLLEVAEQEGHCFVPGGKLVAFAAKLLGAHGGAVEEPAIARELVALEAGSAPRVVRDGTRCYRPETHEAETEVAATVEEMLARVGVGDAAYGTGAFTAASAAASSTSALDEADDIEERFADEWADFDRGAA
jgi:exodeoxyribonuclease V alpha subunit